jgi:hypothetical protein
VGPLAPTGTPVRKPLENLRGMVLRYRMRPLPVVFLRLAFSPQLTVMCYSLPGLYFLDWVGDVHLRVLAAGYPHEAQVCFWMWRERRPVKISYQPNVPNLLFHHPLALFRFQYLRIEWCTYRNACTGCASCYGVYQSWRYPSLYRSQSRHSVTVAGGEAYSL